MPPRPRSPAHSSGSGCRARRSSTTAARSTRRSTKNSAQTKRENSQASTLRRRRRSSTSSSAAPTFPTSSRCRPTSCSTDLARWPAQGLSRIPARPPLERQERLASPIEHGRVGRARREGVGLLEELDRHQVRIAQRDHLRLRLRLGLRLLYRRGPSLVLAEKFEVF